LGGEDELPNTTAPIKEVVVTGASFEEEKRKTVDKTANVNLHKAHLLTFLSSLVLRNSYCDDRELQARVALYCVFHTSVLTIAVISRPCCFRCFLLR
jgi:hypothetical protein